MKEISVVAAIIEHNDKILCVQRGNGKYPYVSHKYEFPGGKVEDQETLEQAIIREIKEELNMVVKPVNFLMTVNHTYPDFHLEMHCFKCSCDSPSLELTEHIDYKWLQNEELNTIDWAAADVPVVERLMNT